jgi:hypothetical protein
MYLTRRLNIDRGIFEIWDVDSPTRSERGIEPGVHFERVEGFQRASGGLQACARRQRHQIGPGREVVSKRERLSNTRATLVHRGC